MHIILLVDNEQERNPMARKTTYQARHIKSDAVTVHGQPKALCGTVDYGAREKRDFFAQPKENRCIRCEAKATKENSKCVS